jgi:hypothetical protein
VNSKPINDINLYIHYSIIGICIIGKYNTINQKNILFT